MIDLGLYSVVINPFFKLCLTEKGSMNLAKYSLIGTTPIDSPEDTIV